MKKPFFSLLLALLFSILNLSSAQAGDAAQLEFIGFSKDGKYMAFEQYGIADGIGAPYSEIHLIDVAKNKYLVRPFKTGPSEMHVIEDPEQSDTALEQVRTLSAKAAQTALKKYGLLEKSRLAGKHLIHHPLYDTGVDPLKVQFALQTPLAGLAFDEYALTLKQKTLKQDCYGFGKAKIFTLRVAPAGTEKQAQVLQEDRILPKSRDCPLSYKIADVYLYKEKSLVVFINMFYPGFEGQDMRYLAVTGTLGSNKKVINKKTKKGSKINMGHSTFSQKYNGRFTSTLRWSQLDDLWTKLRAQPEGWYAYFVSESLPEAPLDSQALDRFIAEVDALLRKDHQHDYCGIVYADSLEKPAMIKIYDPNNLGASCGSSGVKVHPRWLLSQMPPEAIIDDAPTPMNRKRWWQKIFHSSEHA